MAERQLHRRVRTGVERLASGGFEAITGCRVGVITNPTGVFPDLRHEVDVMAAHPAVDLRAVFGPEHGFRGTAQATESEDFAIDARTGLPVYDTFEKTTEEIADAFTKADIDTVVFDIQDVGARFYTYIWTLTEAMQAAARLGMRVVVLDRPNPITGGTPKGPILDPAYESAVGRASIAQQHGMTVGELAVFFNESFLESPVELTIVPMVGWERDMEWEDTGLLWVAPSPNMPSVDTAFAYPGTCLMAGTNLSQGRGTTKPFEIVGAPFMDYRWADALAELGMRGVHLREAHFVPTFSTYKGENCCGVQVFVADRKRFDAVRLGVALLVTAHQLYPETEWLRVEGGAFWMDHLTGSDWVRTQIDAGNGVDEILAGWRGELAHFTHLRRRYLMY